MRNDGCAGETIDERVRAPRMSQGALFGFGCVIFFIVITGALLYGMAITKEVFDREKRIDAQST